MLCERKVRHSWCSSSSGVGAADVVWTPDELREIDRAAATLTVQGARYPEHLQRMTDR